VAGQHGLALVGGQRGERTRQCGPAVVEGESRGPKIRVFKKKRRKGMRRSRGHRSVYTLLRVKEIVI